MVVYRLKDTVWCMHCYCQPRLSANSKGQLTSLQIIQTCKANRNQFILILRDFYQSQHNPCPCQGGNILLVAHESRIFLAFLEKNNSPPSLALVNGTLDRLTLLGAILGLLLRPWAGARSMDISRKLPLSRGSLRTGSYLVSQLPVRVM